MQTNDQKIDWQHWLSLEVKDPKQYRDDLLEPDLYNEGFDELVNGLYTVVDGFTTYKNEKKMGGYIASGRRRLIDAMDLISLQYSAGGNVEFLKELYSYVPQWLEEYAETSHLFNLSPEAHGRFVWHIALGTEDYWYIALRMVCFTMLTGYEDQLPSIMAIIDYKDKITIPEGQEKDGLLERLVANFVPNRGEIPNTARRHLPYSKLFKVFDAEPQQRPDLILQYLEEWYYASRREPYHNKHETTGGISYYGYWSWEAAAVTWLLDIDDTIYRDHQFYPKDLVDFARQQKQENPIEISRLKQQGGERCKKTGYWTTPADPSLRLYVKEGDILPSYEEKDWGIVFWYFGDDK